jgi:UDP-glucuronate 4-epimerase
MKTVLVTGQAGFIGSHLTEKLLKKGYRVVGVDNFNDYYSPKQKQANIKLLGKDKNFKEYRLDILETEKLKKVFEENKIELIAHLAARAGVRPSILNPELYKKVNIQGTKNLLEMAKEFKIKRFILASSSSVYGDQKKVPFSESDRLGKPLSPYAASKQEAEKLCREYAGKYRMQMTILRFFTVYGPRGRPDMAPYLFTEKILKGKPIIRFGDGSSSRDYTYVGDIVEGIIKAVERPFEFEIINLGNNQPVKLNEFIALIEKLIGKKARIKKQPRHPADVKRTYADINKAKKLLGWQPKTDLETGMRKFIEWYKNQRRT